MKVLLSIKPEFAEKIFTGEKKFEYRRVIFKKTGITTILVYVTAPVSKIIGEFKINNVISDKPANLWHKTKEFSGISEEFFNRYFEDKEMGYAIQVGETEKYDQPVSLQEEYNMVPPQSFAYV